MKYAHKVDMILPFQAGDTEIKNALRFSLKRRVPSEIREDEIEAHFTRMPERYWARVDESQLLKHLKIIRSYAEQIVDMGSKRIVPIVQWEHFPDRGYSEVIVCTSDQHGLLAKIAGSFAVVHINVFAADIYTRKDKIALDIFHVCDSKYCPIQDKVHIGKMHDVLIDSLSKHADLPFAALSPFEDQDKAAGSLRLGKNVMTTMAFDNSRSSEYTILEIQTGDYIGLLHDILQALTLCDLEIEQAKINTEDGMAMDAFYLTDSEGGKILSASRLDSIRKQLLEIIAQQTTFAA